MGQGLVFILRGHLGGLGLGFGFRFERKSRNVSQGKVRVRGKGWGQGLVFILRGCLRKVRLGLGVRFCIPIKRDFIEKNLKGKVRARGQGLSQLEHFQVIYIQPTPGLSKKPPRRDYCSQCLTWCLNEFPLCYQNKLRTSPGWISSNPNQVTFIKRF